MQDFIRRRNIEEFEKRLATTTDGNERRILLNLLAEERAKGGRLFLPAREQDGHEGHAPDC